LNLAGRHNIANALAVVALGRRLGLDFKIIQKALEEFKGVERRFQIKYESEELSVVDDYAHHPTEIAATIEAAKALRAQAPGCRFPASSFQPHQASFGHCFQEL
jgi:UDP-N-acetylmuramate--alanine ligase